MSDWDDGDAYALEPGGRRRARFSIWTIVAPIALLACVSVIVVIAREAGWVDARTEASLSGTRPASVPAARTHTVARSPGGSAGATRVFYTIKVGDTLEAIAVRYGSSITRLEALNPAVNPESLQVGQRIRLR